LRSIRSFLFGAVGVEANRSAWRWRVIIKAKEAGLDYGKNVCWPHRLNSCFCLPQLIVFGRVKLLLCRGRLGQMMGFWRQSLRQMIKTE
jgi:hypothetical protein